LEKFNKLGFIGEKRGRPQGSPLRQSFGALVGAALAAAREKQPFLRKRASFQNFLLGGAWTRPYGTPSVLL